MSRSAGSFDASRYFRADDRLGFLNVGTPAVRRMARELVRENRDAWRIDDAMRFADALIVSRYLEVKGVGLEAVACFRGEFTPAHLPLWKRWLADDHASNWATTDLMCGSLIGPLLLMCPRLVKEMPSWSRDRNLWVRRASAVALIPSVRRGLALDTAYVVAHRLHPDDEDLIQKAVGWMLREAGKADARRLERYLRTDGRVIPRTTLRYAIERFSPAKRRELLAVTRGVFRARSQTRHACAGRRRR